MATIAKSKSNEGTAIDRINLELDGTYLGNITLWDNSNAQTTGLFRALQKGAVINGLRARDPVSGGKSAEEIEAEILAQYGA